MSWRERDYARDDNPFDAGAGVRRGRPRPSLRVTTVIIIANVVIAVLTIFTESAVGNLLLNLGVMQGRAVLHGQIWRLFTATYLHADLNHIFLNMLMLYFLGPALERVWGPRQFFVVYTLGGIAGNVVLTLAGAIGYINPEAFGVGASGSILTLLAGGAVLFPNALVYVYFLFPLKIRTFLILYSLWFVYNIYQRGSNYGGDLCHIAGVFFGLWWSRATLRRRGGRSSVMPFGGGARKPVDPREIDRILAKIGREGIERLRPEERQALLDAAEDRDRDPSD
ncbi:MAG: rhomboid family intramembrane serine protease [Phycisphaerae bacterium]